MKVKYLSTCFLCLAILFYVGWALPFMISADSNELVVAGLISIVFAVPAVIMAAKIILKRRSKREKN